MRKFHLFAELGCDPGDWKKIVIMPLKKRGRFARPFIQTTQGQHMRKLVVAGLLALTVFGGWQSAAFSQPLFRAFQPQVAQSGQPVILAQSSGDAVRIQQLQEEIRQLNGRIEEMSFQLLQMQEQMRKTQEDNEFRFQDLEKGGVKKKSEAAPDSTMPSVAATPAPPAATGATDDVATIIATQDGAGVPPATDGTNGAPPMTLGSVKFDANGNPIGSTANAPGANASSLPGTETASTAPKASALGSAEELYKAAYGHVLTGDYAVAETEFQTYVDTYPKGGKIADATFWMGEAQYSQGKYSDAARTFLNGHQTYGKSQRAPEMLLKLGMSLAALENKDVACKTLREVGVRYPAAAKAVLTKATSEQKRLACPS